MDGVNCVPETWNLVTRPKWSWQRISLILLLWVFKLAFKTIGIFHILRGFFQHQSLQIFLEKLIKLRNQPIIRKNGKSKSIFITAYGFYFLNSIL